jgi:hypothetical protein
LSLTHAEVDKIGVITNHECQWVIDWEAAVSESGTLKKELDRAPVSHFGHPVATQIELHFAEGEEDFEPGLFDAEE